MRWVPLLLSVLVLTGCFAEIGSVGGQSQQYPTDELERPGNSGPAPVRLSTFQSVSVGVPSTSIPQSSAPLGGVVYLTAGDAASSGLYALDAGATSWRSVTLALKGAERVTSVSNIDNAILVTVADSAAGGGGVFRLDLGATDFVRLANAPAAPAWTLARKGSTLLLATTGGLFASSDRGASWARRSAAFAPLFLQAVQGVFASSAAQRIFAVAADGALHHSDDEGASWSTGLVRGKVSSLAMSSSFVLLTSDLDGPQRSDNYGATFHPLTSETSAQAFAVVGTRAFAGTTSGVRVSDDGGAKWRDASEGLPPSTSVKELFAAGTTLVAAGNSGIYVADVE
jgi:hypothetical protein